jgi:nucleotide-binding universal stress UspA family protein
MKRFKKILIVFDSKTDNRALFDQAVELAQRNQTVLTVIDVIEEAPSGLSRQFSLEPGGMTQQPNFSFVEELPNQTKVSPAADPPDDGRNGNASSLENNAINIQEYIAKEEQRSLQQYVATIRKTGIQVNSKTLFGIPFIKIIQEVLQSKHDLVMITADGSGGIKETLFGSTTMHLMRKCPCPVWVIKPGQAKHFNRILAAVDLNNEDNERATLAKRIMDLATSLAGLDQSELLILHAWSLYGESILRGRGGVSDATLKKLLQETRDTHRQWVTELLQQYSLDGLKSEAYLLKGDAGVLITELVREKAVDLLVMGTVSRAGLSGLLIGNTAERVLHQVDCSILTIKPEGFVTPVKVDMI